MKLSLSQIAEYLKVPTAELGPSTYNQTVASGYSIDSRTLNPGEVFFAVKGEKFDGHDFVAQAFERGSIAAVVSKEKLAEVRQNWDKQRAGTPAPHQPVFFP